MGIITYLQSYFMKKNENEVKHRIIKIEILQLTLFLVKHFVLRWITGK